MEQIPNEEMVGLDQDAKEILAEMEQEVPESKPEQKAEEPAQEVVEEKPEEKQQPESEPPQQQTEEIKPEVSRMIPLAKYQTKKKKWEEEREELVNKISELEEKVNQVSSSVNSTQDARLDEIATKWNLDKQLLKDLSQIVPKASVPDDILEEINALREEKALNEQKALIESNYQKELKDLENNHPEIDFSLVDKDKLRELAFSPRFAHTDLETIYRAYKDSLVRPVAKKTFEQSGNIVQPEQQDYSRLTDESISKMSDEEFDKYMAAKGKDGLLKKT